MSETIAAATETPVDTAAPTDTPAISDVQTPVDTTVTATPAAPAEVTPQPAADPAPATPEAKGYWPSDWRDKLAEALKPGDANFRKRLDRMVDPTAIGKSWLSLETKQSSGELKKALSPEATPEEVQAWRKENGLPEKAEDYKPELPDGVVLGETDKQVLEGFQKFMFDQNMTPDVMNKTLAWYFQEQQRVNEAQELADADFHESTKENLIAEWGLKDYKANLAVMGSLRDQMPGGLADRILAGRMADGRLIGDDPQFLSWFAQLARDVSPTATLTSIGVDNIKSLDEQVKSIERTMQEDPAKYWKDDTMQARYRELLETRDRFASRS